MFLVLTMFHCYTRFKHEYFVIGNAMSKPVCPCNELLGTGLSFHQER